MYFLQEFEAFAVTLMSKIQVKRAGQVRGEIDSQIWMLLFSHVKAAHMLLGFDILALVAANEVNRRIGHSYLTVFADLVGKRVLLANHGKDASVWEAFAAEKTRLNKAGRSQTV